MKRRTVVARLDSICAKSPSCIQVRERVTDYKDAIDSIKRNLKFQIDNGDPFFAKHPMTDKEIESFVDKRFFAGGEYFFDTSEKQRASASAEPPASSHASTRQLARNGH